jgi:zinc transporter ZupT
MSGEWQVALVRAAFPVAAALVGALVGAYGVVRSRAGTALAVNFAAGAFVGVAVLYLLPEAAREVGISPALLAAGGGGLACALLTRWAGTSCPACDAAHGRGHEPLYHAGLGPPLLAVVALHSLLDGLPLASGHHHHHAEIVSLVVLLHKFPEGMAVAAVCRARGQSAPLALGITAAVQAATFGGAALGALLGEEAAPVFALALAGVAGSFAYLAWLAARGASTASRPALGVGVLAVGLFLVVLARLAFA